jgi:hypothetical protein
MNIFDNKGMMIFPNPQKADKQIDKLIVVKECFCPKGHDLINKRVNFNGFNGIFLKVKHFGKSGFVGLSPIFGDKSRIFLDIDVKKDDILELYCAHCNTELPVYSTCNCGSKILSLFTTRNLEFSDCIGICNKVDCVNSEIISENQMITLSTIDLGLL